MKRAWAAAALLCVAAAPPPAPSVTPPPAAPVFMAYWLGYHDGGAALEATPPEVNIVALAFAVTGPSPQGDTATLDFLTSKHPLPEILAGVKALKARGVRVVLSINGNPHWPGHENGWARLNADAFAANVAGLVRQLGVDGVDLDNESRSVTPGKDFVAVIVALRRALGPDALITLPVYHGADRDRYLAHVRDQISFISTMGYWYRYDGQISLFQDYAKLVGPAKVAIGVSNGQPRNQDTDVTDVPRLAAWNPDGATKAGMMLWDLNESAAPRTREWVDMIVEGKR